MGIKFLNDAEATKKVAGTYVLWCGKPCYVIAAQARYLTLRRLQDGSDKAFVVGAGDDDLVINRTKLGFYFTGTDANYLVRVPTRQYQAPPSLDTIHCEPNMPSMWACREEMENCILGNHPSLKEAYDILNSPDNTFNRIKGVPFHRHFALKRKGRCFFLKYKRQEVGPVQDVSRDGEWRLRAKLYDENMLSPLKLALSLASVFNLELE